MPCAVKPFQPLTQRLAISTEQAISSRTSTRLPFINVMLVCLFLIARFSSSGRYSIVTTSPPSPNGYGMSTL